MTTPESHPWRQDATQQPTQKQKAVKHAADLAARQRSMMIVEPELTQMPRATPPRPDGYALFLAAKHAREHPEEAQKSLEPLDSPEATRIAAGSSSQVAI